MPKCVCTQSFKSGLGLAIACHWAQNRQTWRSLVEIATSVRQATRWWLRWWIQVLNNKKVIGTWELIIMHVIIHCECAVHCSCWCWTRNHSNTCFLSVQNASPRDRNLCISNNIICCFSCGNQYTICWDTRRMCRRMSSANFSVSGEVHILSVNNKYAFFTLICSC